MKGYRVLGSTAWGGKLLVTEGSKVQKGKLRCQGPWASKLSSSTLSVKLGQVY